MFRPPDSLSTIVKSKASRRHGEILQTRRWRTRVHQLLMPPRCLLCDGAGQPDDLLDLCSGCEADLPRLKYPCRICANPLPAEDLVCMDCLRAPPTFDRVFAPFSYRWPVDEMLLGLKFGGQLAFGRALGTLLARQLAAEPAFSDEPFTIVPVPLHWRRHVGRGFNQAQELARVLARLPGATLQHDLCRRAVATPAQSGLRARLRRRNVRGAFKVVATPPPSILLVDDIMTTGSTCNELARVIKRAGARIVRVACVARA